MTTIFYNGNNTLDYTFSALLHMLFRSFGLMTCRLGGKKLSHKSTHKSSFEKIWLLLSKLLQRTNTKIKDYKNCTQKPVIAKESWETRITKQSTRARLLKSTLSCNKVESQSARPIFLWKLRGSNHLPTRHYIHPKIFSCFPTKSIYYPFWNHMRTSNHTNAEKSRVSRAIANFKILCDDISEFVLPGKENKNKSIPAHWLRLTLCWLQVHWDDILSTFLCPMDKKSQNQMISSFWRRT